MVLVRCRNRPVEDRVEGPDRAIGLVETSTGRCGLFGRDGSDPHGQASRAVMRQVPRPVSQSRVHITWRFGSCLSPGRPN